MVLERRSFRNIIVRLQHRLSMTRAEFTAISVAGGLLLVGYAADLVAHRYSRVPSERFAEEDSIFFQLAGRMDAGAALGPERMVVDPGTSTVESVASGTDSSMSYTTAASPKRQLLSGASTSVTAEPGGPIDLNRATRAQLVQLPGIGPALADRIVRSRERDGPFASVADLQRVSGIGPVKQARLEPFITVGQAADSLDSP